LIDEQVKPIVRNGLLLHFERHIEKILGRSKYRDLPDTVVQSFVIFEG
jgi:hypothetical protein